MWSSSRKPSQPQSKKQEREWIGGSFKAENFIPGIVIGFILGMLLDLSKQVKSPIGKSRLLSSKTQKQSTVSSNGSDQELKMVLVVRQDLKMRAGKIASQCAHAATGMYAELMQSDRYLLRRWEQCGQPKIVVTCKNQQEMNRIIESAENVGLPTFVVADAGRTQVAAGSKTVLAVGPGPKELVDSITGRLALL
ncbi:PREDICTED: peptidyl-tRNA hydrolase 2, mitochondrial isoform X1 [Tarenaya hassleriana]|uniref:peptidyl-tRNA hydrolase 2, mitochondrial isoform X1 n=2 Tax=Tarenaya hassleriana TaxID=28532 RepID=UPI00053C114E|nr:PREDICTED: peptidyl-tRNA hydrolase 2, mitochondrial isoform X1 [Tarenaya hassleriana]